MLAAQQWLMAERDFLVRGAVDAIGAGLAPAAARAALFIFAASAAAAVVRLASRATLFAGGRNVEYELRAALLAQLHRLGPSFFREHPTGEVMSRATNDLAQVRLLLGFGVLNIIGSALALASALYVMASISGRLTLAALAVWPVLALVTRAFSARLFARSRQSQQVLGELSGRLLASLAGGRVVRSLGMAEAEVAALERESRRYLAQGLLLARLRGSMWPVVGTITAAGVLVVFWYGASLLLAGRISTGGFAAFWLALLRLSWPMLAVGFVASIVQRGRASHARLCEIFAAEPEIADGGARAPERFSGAVRVSHLHYAYGDRDVLRDVSFAAPAAGSLALVGRTGAGKSTLGALLARPLPTPPGTVFLDGSDVCLLPLCAVRGAIGYAPQDAFLFSTTVAENIAYGLPEDKGGGAEDPARTARVAEAAAAAQIHAEVLGLPEGFDTVVGERGVQLSGGQRQRVALARALVREPAVLVLDDPLSAVDTETEAAILEAIERQARERTLILITHRVAAAQRCARVLVLDRGRVVEQGTHEELCAAGGLYALLAAEQRLWHELDELAHGSPPARVAPEDP
ncbi:MAG: ABC transporter ATP-binding protein [Deltaproteobacteria bacterium]|nr:ABC transporter ATP-binding protein [Deltaproteobacteria bacterium]